MTTSCDPTTFILEITTMYVSAGVADIQLAPRNDLTCPYLSDKLKSLKIVQYQKGRTFSTEAYRKFWIVIFSV